MLLLLLISLIGEIGMIKIYHFPRTKSLPNESLYLYFNVDSDVTSMHLLEHLLISRIKKKYPNIPKVEGYTNSDYIKITFTTGYLKYIDQLSLENTLNEFNETEFERAKGEISQEISLYNNNIKDLLDSIRNINSKREDECKCSLIEFNEWVEEMLPSIKVICFSENNFNQNDNKIISVFDQRHDKLSIQSKEGLINFQKGKYIYRYVNIPISKVEQKSSIYFLQNFMNYLMQQLTFFRDQGAYYALSFAEYHRNYIEIFIIISVTDLIKDNLEKRLEQVINNYEIVQSTISNSDAVYVYKEDLAATYLVPEFTKLDVPKVESKDKKFIEEIKSILL